MASGVVAALLFTELLLYTLLRFIDIPWGPGVTPYQEKYFQLNSHGYRDIEWEQKKVDGTKRIVVIGDSFVFSPTKDKNDGLVPNLRAAMSMAISSTVEIINLGKIGANTADELGILNNDGFSLEPDLLILVYVPNDADPLTRADSLLPKHTFNLFEEFRLFRQSVQRSVELNDPTILRHFLKTRSFVFNLLDTSFGRILTLLHIRPSPLEEETRRLYSGENLVRHQNDLAAFTRITKEKNIPFLIVYFPFLFDLNDDPFADIAKMVGTIAHEENADFLDLTPTLESVSMQDLVIDWSDAHPNGKANAIASQAIAQFLATSHKEMPGASREERKIPLLQ